LPVQPFAYHKIRALVESPGTKFSGKKKSMNIFHSLSAFAGSKSPRPTRYPGGHRAKTKQYPQIRKAYRYQCAIIRTGTEIIIKCRPVAGFCGYKVSKYRKVLQ